MHFGPWEVAAFGSLYIGAFLLAADVGLRMAPNIQKRLPGIVAFQESGLWAFTPFVLLTISGAIFLANAVGGPNSEHAGWMNWPFLAPVGLLLLVLLIWLAKRRGPLNGGDDESIDFAPGNREMLDSIDRFGKQIASLTAKTKSLTDSSDAIRNLDRTAFLLATSVADSLTKNELQKCLKELPVPPPPDALSSDERAGHYTGLLNKYFRETGSRLSGSRWGNLLISTIRTAEYDADTELRDTKFPPELHPQGFRLFHIAYLTRERVQEFLERAIAEAEDSERQMLQMIRERPEIHGPPRR